MDRLKEVSEARAVMTEAMDWPVVKWLTEKKRVRRVADSANAALDRAEQQLHERWDDDLKMAYAAGGNASGKISAELQRLALSIRQAHDAAMNARMDAEETFAKAEKRLSTSMAREGCHKALAGWDLHEEAIRKAAAAANGK